jgi:hypothetical protein
MTVTVTVISPLASSHQLATGAAAAAASAPSEE